MNRIDYDTSGSIPFKAFSILTKQEKDFANQSKDFADNRARITLTDSPNRVWPREMRNPDIPLPCSCELEKDTVRITVAAGFMAGFAILTTIHKNKFNTRFYQEADGTEVFKPKESDSAYVSKIAVDAAEQKMTFSGRPSFFRNEIITGRLDVRFSPFYERQSGEEPVIARKYRVKLLFKCRLYEY